MKTCPVCQARAFDDAEVCYGCMHHFKTNSEEESLRGKAGNVLWGQETGLPAMPEEMPVQKSAEESPVRSVAVLTKREMAEAAFCSSSVQAGQDARARVSVPEVLTPVSSQPCESTELVFRFEFSGCTADVTPSSEQAMVGGNWGVDERSSPRKRGRHCAQPVVIKVRPSEKRSSGVQSLELAANTTSDVV